MWRIGSSSRELIVVSASTSLSHIHSRPLTISAVSRLVPHPPDLVKWVRVEGGFVHQSVKIAHVPSHGLGLVASDDIPYGSDLISLPPHLPLKLDDEIQPNDENVVSSSVLASLAQEIPEELWAMRLGVKLLQERAKKGSFWWPYISNLPEMYNVPIFFQGEDIKNLQYAPLLYQVNRRCRFLLDFETKVRHTVSSLNSGDHPFWGQDIDASSLGWAMSAVSSRAFCLHGDKLSITQKDLPMMLPLIDMCNHSFNPNAKIIQDQDPQNSKMLVKVVAEKHIKRDDPLELNYGCLSNDLFLLDYGFVMTMNPYDCVELRYDGALLDAASMATGISSSCFSSPASWQQEILSQLGLHDSAPNLKVTIGGADLVEGRFLAAVRVLHASDAEIVHKQPLSTLQSWSSEAPLGFSNEVAALRTFIALCVIVLEHFPTKIMEDELLLKQGVSIYSELAIQFRVQKKLLIINVMKEMSKRIKLVLAKESATTAQV